MKTLVFITLLMGAVVAGSAQYKGPSIQSEVLSVEEVKSKASMLDMKDKLVKLRGYVTKKLGDEKYVFQDNTGEIIAEIDNELIWNITFDEKTEVVVIAEVDSELFQSPEVDVKSISLAK